MGLFKKVFRPVRKIAKKIIPKEVKPFLPYIAAGFGPSTVGLTGTAFAKAAAQKALIAAATSAATDEQGDPLRAGLLAITPDVASQGLGAVSQKFGPTQAVDIADKLTFAERIGEGARRGQEFIKANEGLKTVLAQTGVDQAAKFAEINQQELDEYNKNLREQGVLDKTKRRTAIYNIYINAGYEPDYVNSMLDRYGYDEGGLVKALRALKAKMKAPETVAKQMSGRLRRKPTDDDNDDDMVIPPEKPKKDDNEDEKPVPVRDVGKDDLTSGLMAAASGVEKAFGRPFGNMEPVPMLRFARGGEVEIEEETEDLGILDFMKDQGVPYGEMASDINNERVLEQLYEQFLDMGLSPAEAAKAAREAFDRMSKRSDKGIMQMAKSDIEDMYEQYVFEMEEMGVTPMSFSEFVAREKAGMKDGGKVRRRKKGEPMDDDGEKPGPRSFPKFDEDRLFEEKMPQVLPNKPDMMDAAMGGIASMADGGIMEKDMRGGGFIPEGSKERADDVPARLSKNEFVMTADAVRAAGGGSVNKGAKRMYDMMYSLEGKI